MSEKLRIRSHTIGRVSVISREGYLRDRADVELYIDGVFMASITAPMPPSAAVRECRILVEQDTDYVDW